jgi:RNA polymerase sigma-70 factor (ECF subfamily)
MSAVQPNRAITTTATNTHLLQGLRSPQNHSIWRDFVARYRPMIVSYARKSFGLSIEDAEDAAQITLADFAEAYRDGQYDREKGRLRKWLFGIATNRLKSFARGRARNREVQVADASGATGFMPRIRDDDRLEAAWDQEWRQAVLRQCMEEIRFQFDAKTVEAFELYVLKDLPAKEVADRLEMSRNAVYLARHHILKRFQEILPRLEETW